MTTQNQDLEDSTDEAPDPAGLRHRADEALNKAKDAEARAEAAERRATFAEAGIPTEGLGALFRKAYDGDLTVEAMKASAAEYGILDQPRPNEEIPVMAQSEMEGLGTVASGLASNDNPVAPPQGAMATNLEIVKLAKAGDDGALISYLESQGLLMDPDSASTNDLSMLNQTPRMAGVEGQNPVGVNPQVV